jgi:hypothetical protein
LDSDPAVVIAPLGEFGCEGRIDITAKTDLIHQERQPEAGKAGRGYFHPS